jgi:hypothetical protein
LSVCPGREGYYRYDSDKKQFLNHFAVPDIYKCLPNSTRARLSSLNLYSFSARA